MNTDVVIKKKDSEGTKSTVCVYDEGILNVDEGCGMKIEIIRLPQQLIKH